MVKRAEENVFLAGKFKNIYRMGELYYRKFLPNLSNQLKSFYELLQIGVLFNWSKICERSFQQLEKIIANSRVLIPYKLELSFTIAADASPRSLGVAISNILSDGIEKLIHFRLKFTNKG